jgi:glycosyltransferase involved in cell wall biosynthesis
MKHPELAMVMPVYNEEGAIRNVVRKWTDELQRFGIDFEIHAYNDGSKDQSLQILKDLAQTNQRLIVHDKPNSGHGPTILQGYRENSDAQWIFQIDSDDEIACESFQELWEKRDSFDFLIGSRIRANQPLPRKIVSSLSRATVKIFYGTKVYDVNSPYRLMRCEGFRKYFWSLPEDLFAPNVIISGIASVDNLRVCEIPVQQRERSTGEVSIKKFRLLKAALKSYRQTISCRFRLRNLVQPHSQA